MICSDLIGRIDFSTVNNYTMIDYRTKVPGYDDSELSSMIDHHTLKLHVTDKEITYNICFVILGTFT